MKPLYVKLFIFLFFVSIPLFIYRKYFFYHQIPFPSNLLVSYYEPWKSYPFPEYPNGPPNKPLGFDNIRQYYPQKSVVLQLIEQLQPPLWNPYAFSGNTLLSTYQSAIFHPLSWLYFILPQIDAYSIIIILQPFFALYFMFLYLQTLSLSRISSIIGALSLALSGFAIVWWEESYMIGYASLALPLILYSIEKFFAHFSNRYMLTYILALCWTVFSGSFQLTLYVYIFTAVYIVWKIRNHHVRHNALKTIVIGTFIAFCLCAIQIIPGFEAYTASARGTTDVKFLFTSYLLPLKQLITLISPDFFGSPAAYNYYSSGFYHERMIYFGITPFILTILAFSYLRLKDKESFWGYCFLIFLTLGMNLPTSWFILYSLKLPLISTMIPSRILFLAMFCGSVLSAYGLEYYRKSLPKTTVVKAIVFISILFLSAWCFIWFEKYSPPMGKETPIQIRNMILPTILACITCCILWFGKSSTRTRTVVGMGCILLTIGNAFYFSNKYLFFSERKYVFPQTPILTQLKELTTYERVWTFGTGWIDNNFLTQYSLFSPEGYDSFYIRRYGELLHAGAYQGLYSQEINRSDALILSESRIDQILTNPYRTRLLQLLGVKYIAGHLAPPRDVTPPLIPPPELKKVWSDEIYAIYQYNDALPRTFLVNDVKILKTNQEILHTLFSESFNPRESIILEEQPENIPKTTDIVGKASILTYTPQEIIIKTDSDTPALLFLSDNYYPGWKATVDGTSVKIYRANYTFRAVPIPEGSHTVIFRYQPDSWRYGVLISTFGLVILCLLVTPRFNLTLE